MLSLLNELIRRAEHGERVALCVLVRSRGSTPQKAGAVMLVLADGQALGTLGGGCVEAEVRSRALKAIAAATARVDQLGADQMGSDQLVAFKLDQDYGWDDGMVCGGILDVAIQLFDRFRDLTALRAARDQLLARQTAQLTITLPSRSPSIPESSAEDSTTGTSKASDSSKTVSFTISLTPPPRLVIAGAGHVAMALAAIAGPIGFDLTVIDDRPDFANAERFPAARCVVGDIGLELSRLPIDPQTCIVIVTRGHRNDADALAAVVRSAAGYIGLIGSRRKIRTLLHDLDQRGVPRETLLTVHAPIGLRIGAITPAEIAVSIAAELIAVRRQAPLPAGSMKLDPAELTKWLDLLPPGRAT